MTANALKRAAHPPFADKYDVERVLGRGGMGTVFEARHLRLGHRVAIKVLGEELRLHPELVKRFEREARAAGALSSPRAVKVFDIDQTEDGTPFMVMELLKGRDLADLVERCGPQPVGCSVRWIVEACDAIAEAHELGIVHRDIKPSNIFLCRDTGSVKVLDFGIAKRVAPKEAAITLGVAPLGTPQYMSPEQVRCAKDVDGRTDVWSLGVTLYELVCGRPPFNHDVAQACIAAIAADPIPDPREFRADLPEDLALVIMHALEKNPDERFQTIAELVTALEPFADVAASAEADSWRTISTTRARRRADTAHTTPSGERVLQLASEFGADLGETEVPPAAPLPIERLARNKRIRSTIMLASAALFGLGALVATPRCVSGLGTASTTNVHAVSGKIGDVVDTASLLPVRSATADETVAPRPEEVADVASAVVAARAASTPGTTTVTGVPVEDLAPKNGEAGLAAAPAPRASARPVKPLRAPSTTARVIGSDRPVHGGISNPGF